MVPDVMQADGCVIGNEEAAVERQLADQGFGRQSVPVQEPDQRNNRRGQPRYGQHGLRQADHEIPVLGGPRFLHSVVHPVAYVKHRI